MRGASAMIKSMQQGAVGNGHIFSQIVTPFVDFDHALAALSVPAVFRNTVWLRLEPLRPWAVQTPFPDVFGVFVAWKTKSISCNVIDAMWVVDRALCMQLRRICHGQLRVVDNTCLPAITPDGCYMSST